MTSLRFAPIVATGLGIAWTVLVFRFSEYGDDWATSPVIALFIASFLIHILLVTRSQQKWRFIGYALLHLPFQATVFLACLMLIAKDSF